MERSPETLSSAALEDRVAAAFLERCLLDRATGAPRDLVTCLRDHPGFETRVAREWLALHDPTGSIDGITPAHAPTPVHATAPTTLLPTDGDPKTIGPYRLISELGRGGQGVVYFAEDSRTHRRVALKLLLVDILGLSAAASLRLEREASVLARLEHPGIATVFEVGRERGAAWFAMRYVEGGSVHEMLEARRSGGDGPPRTPHEIRAALRLGERAARALHVAHQAGIVHRDIKPANLLLAAPDVPVLVDFGLAHDTGSPAATITLPGAVCGTVGYLPPERLSGVAADERADVYGLGAVLYELLTLNRPFQAPTLAAELRSIAHDELPDLRLRNPAAPQDVALVIATALERDPALRYQSAVDLADDLARLLNHETIHARPVGIRTRLRRFLEREPALAIALVSLVAVLASGLATSTWLWRRESRALADVTRLADLDLARALVEREATLWPALPDRQHDLGAWLRDARALGARSPQHRARLARLPDVGADPTADWQRGQLETLLRELAHLDRQVASVEQRAAFASSVVARTLDDAASDWREVRERVAADPRYGFDLQPQVGLLPLGPDPTSGLEEFAHPASGAVPVRDAAGRLPITEDSCIVLVLVGGGWAILGADREIPGDGRDANIDASVPVEFTPSYGVRLDPFLLSKFEMTQAQWLRHTSDNPSTYKPDAHLSRVSTTLHPVEMVSWEACDRVVRELDLTLPTEAQWEWAYRAGSRTPYPYGSGLLPQCLDGHENLADRFAMEHGRNDKWRFLEWLDDGFVVHAPVGSFQPNPFGFYDMGGNVKEWCADSWEDYPAVAPQDGDGLRRGQFDRYRIVRGGGFASSSEDPRAAARGGVERESAGAEAGLRPARRLRKR